MNIDDIVFQEVKTGDNKIIVGIFKYIGDGDPVKNLNDAIALYVGNKAFSEFIDANMDNPWIRVILKGVNDMGQMKFNPKKHHL